METVEELKTRIKKLEEECEFYKYLFYTGLVKDLVTELKITEIALEDCSEEDREDLEDLHKEQNEKLLEAYVILAPLRRNWADKKIEEHLKKLERDK